MNEPITLKEPLTGLLPHQREAIGDSRRTGFTWTQTFTGKQFWPADPRPEDIDILDIAHALSMLCRFNGHCKRFYSVAEHSVFVSKVIEQEHARWGLMHDAAEAYIGDMPKPAKGMVTGFIHMEDLIMKAVAERFGLPWPCPEEVKHMDLVVLSTEQHYFVGPQVAPWAPMPPPVIFDGGKTWRGFSPKEAKYLFLDRFNELF